MSNDVTIKRNPYINTQGQRELHKSITAFIDILGFSERVKKAKQENSSQELFVDFHRVLSEWYSRTENSWEGMFEMPFPRGQKDRYKIRIFTDCVLIGCPITKENGNSNFIKGCDELHDVLSLLYIFQLEMTNNGYFVRGSIAVDELYMDETIIYGNGLIEAYEAETKQAKYPRIILTKSASDMLEEISNGFLSKGIDNYINSFFYRDSDGQIFLNYLESIKIGDDNYQFVDELEKHKNIIELMLEEHKSNPHCLEKYVWTAGYHNAFCEYGYGDYKINLAQYQMQPVAGQVSVLA